MAVLLQVAERLQDNYPYFHPLYAGQMLKPPHHVAWLAHALTMLLNPNNHAVEGGRASSRMEAEAVAEIAAMFGWPIHLGHLTGGGTIANLEALWVASKLHERKTIVASTQAHYTHGRLCSVLGLNFEAIACDRFARMDMAELKQRLGRGDVGTVVVTVGTTATGAIDPLDQVLKLRDRYDFRVHVDAAYGGYFVLADNLDARPRRIFDLLREVDSIVIDPHKHGLQPYGCGCVIFRDPSIGRFYKHDSPYTYFRSAELHLGEISLECSRAGAHAVGLWATQKLLPLVRGGQFAQSLGRSLAAARRLHSHLQADTRFVSAFPPELDIVIWMARASRVSEASELARLIFEEAERRQLYLALADLPCDFFDLEAAGIERDRETVLCLRSVLMKPEHLDWIDPIWLILDEATSAILARHAPRISVAGDGE
jgi:glutamate/tyrosine decarboxylase-like PLP-dependent enzyme